MFIILMFVLTLIGYKGHRGVLVGKHLKYTDNWS